jgi:hypothetical protein
MGNYGADSYPGTPNANYHATTLTSGTLVVTGLIKSIRLFAVAADATCKLTGDLQNILSGDTIQLRSGTGVDTNWGYRLQNVTVTWLSGTIDVLVLFVTPTT